MKRSCITFGLLLALGASAPAAERQKSFQITVDPPDAVIKVVSGSDLKERRYLSPASVTATIADEPDRAKKNVIEITRERYKPVVIPLPNLREGEVLKIRLEKALRKQLKFRMVAPLQSDTLQIRDAQIQLGLLVDEKQMQMNVTNNTPQPIRVLWQRASYTDPANQVHRVMHPGIRYQDRNRSFPYQTIMPFMTVHQAVMPVDMITPGREMKTLEQQPLFPPDAVERFKGKNFELLIPIEIGNRGVVPYRFKVKILGSVQE